MRVQVMARFFLPALVLWLVGLAAYLLYLFLNVSWLVPWAIWLIAGTFAFLGSLRYRCPVCHRVPTDRGGIAYNPKTCEKCGALLRWRDEV